LTQVSSNKDQNDAKPVVLPWWFEVVKLAATGLAAALATIVAGYFVFFNQGRELDIKMVDISLAILSGDRGGADGGDAKEYTNARMFALRALSRYSHVDIPSDEMQAWAESGLISFGAVPLTGTDIVVSTAPPLPDPAIVPTAEVVTFFAAQVNDSAGPDASPQERCDFAKGIASVFALGTAPAYGAELSRPYCEGL
jgi:hypothetical protein